MQKVLLSFVFSMSLVFVKAQQVQQYDISDTVDVLAPVEVRAIRAGTKAPFAVANIYQKEIGKQNLAQNLPYFLNQLPSVVVSSDDGVGVGYTGMRVRGTDLTRTNYTINGIPVNDPESQVVVFVNFGDLASSVNSIQLQRGVGSSTNGPGAFGASVNISNLEQGRVPYAKVDNSSGSFNTWKHTVRAGTGKLKGGFQFDVRLSKISSDGYIQRAFSDLKSLQFISSWTSKDENTSLKFNLFTGKERTGQAWNGLEVSFTGTDSPQSFNYADTLSKMGRRTNTIGKMANGEYYKDQTDNYQQDYYQLFFNHKFNSNWSANVAGFLTRGRGFYNEYKSGQKYSSYGLKPFVKAVGDTLFKTDLIRQLWLDNHYYGSVFSANYQTEATDVNIGGAYTMYDGKHYGFVKWAQHAIEPDYRWYNHPADKNDFNMFAKWQQMITDGLYGYVDLQYRNVQYHINGSRKDASLRVNQQYNFFNPKAGLSYLIRHLNGQSKVYGSFAVANKEPNRNDFEAAQKNALPQHETLYDYELGYLYNGTVLNAGINLYYMDYKNQLILTGKINDVGEATRANVDKSYRSGIELTAGYQPVAWLNINASAAFSKNKLKDFTEYYYIVNENWDPVGEESKTYSNTNIAFSPNVVASAAVTFEPFYAYQSNNHFFIELLGKHVGRQYLDNSSNIMKSINPYSLFDARLRYDLKPSWIKDLSIIVMLNNILDKQYESNGFTYSSKSATDNVLYTTNGYYPQAGFNFNVGLSLGF